MIGFIRWWLAALRGGTAERAHRGPAMQARAVGDSVLLETLKGRPIAALDRDHVRPSGLRRYPHTRTRIVIPVDSAKVLDRPVELPSAAAENLRQVLYLQMDQVTPFVADDVVYSADVLPAARGEATMQVSLRVAPRRLVAAECAALRAAGYPLPFECARVEPHGTGFAVVFTPPARSDGSLAFAALVWAFNVSLLGGLVGWPLWEQQRALEAIEAALGEVRADALAAAEVRDEIDRLQAENTALRALGPRAPSIVQVLDELAERLPVTTWLEQVAVKDGQVTIRGISAQAPQLLARLDASPWFAEAALRSAQTATGGQRGERFVIVARLVSQTPVAPSSGDVTPQVRR